MVSFIFKAGVLGCLLASVGVEAVPDSSVWSYVSCYVNQTPSTRRTLGYQKRVAAGAEGMTVEGCQDVCFASGYTLAGLARSNECYCDNDVRHGRPAPDGETQCNMPCTGDDEEMCGGSSRLNLYAYGNAPTSSTCDATTTPGPVTVTISTTLTIPGAGEVTTVTIPGEEEVITVTVPTTLTIPGAGEVTTITVPTTVTLPGEDEVITITVPTTLTIPGAGEVTTVTVPGEEEVITVTVPTTVTLPGEAVETTITVPTTVTLPGEAVETTVTIPTTVTLPGEVIETTVTVPTTLTIPGAGEVTTVTVPGEEEVITVTVPTTLTIEASTVTTTETSTVAPENTCTATQAVQNSGFETGQLNSDVWISASSLNLGAGTFAVGNSNSGTKALQIQGTATNWGGTIRQSLSVCENQRYIFKGFGKISGTNNNCQMWFSVGGSMIGTKFTPSINAYTAIGGVVTIPAGVTTANVDLVFTCTASGAANKVFFDDITLTLL